MPKIIATIFLISALVTASVGATPKSGSDADHNSIVIFFKDGHQQSFSLDTISRIEFTPSATTAAAAWPAHFAGTWKVGDGAGGTFFITLKRDGEARKTTGASHGTWSYVNGEARISWDDGWRDIIRKVGDGYEKAAFEPGKSLDGKPSNVADAKSTEPI